MITKNVALDLMWNRYKLHVMVAPRLDGQGYRLVLTVCNERQYSGPSDVSNQTAEQVIAYTRGVFETMLGMLAGEPQYTEDVDDFRRIIQEVLKKFTGPGIIHTYHHPTLVFVPTRAMV